MPFYEGKTSSKRILWWWKRTCSINREGKSNSQVGSIRLWKRMGRSWKRTPWCRSSRVIFLTSFTSRLLKRLFVRGEWQTVKSMIHWGKSAKKSPELDGLLHKVYMKVTRMFVPILMNVFSQWFAQGAISG